MNYDNLYHNDALFGEEDRRSFLFELYSDKNAMGLDIEYDDPFINQWFNPNSINKIESQGTIGACVSFALTSYLENIIYKHTGKRVQLSPWFIYHLREKTDHQGEGMYPIQALKTVLKYGVCLLEDYNNPIKYEDYVKNPTITQDIIDKASKYKISAFYKVNPKNAREVKRALITTGGLLSAYTLKTSFYMGRKDGVAPRPTSKENVIGNHAMFTVADNEFTHLKTVNSWGGKWDIDGVVFLPINWHAREMWAVAMYIKNPKFKVFSSAIYSDKEKELNEYKIWVDQLAKLGIEAKVEKINGYHLITCGTFDNADDAEKQVEKVSKVKHLLSGTFIYQIFDIDVPSDPTPPKPQPNSHYEIGKYNVILRCNKKYDNMDEVEEAIEKLEKKLNKTFGRKKVEYNDKYDAILLYSFDNSKDMENLYRDIKYEAKNKNVRREPKSDVKSKNWKF